MIAGDTRAPRFTMTLAATEITNWRGPEVVAGRARAVKACAFLGPWCSDCGKALKVAREVAAHRCHDSEKCRTRVLARVATGRAPSGAWVDSAYRAHMAKVRAQLAVEIAEREGRTA